MQQIQNAKYKLLTVEWHKEAADQSPQIAKDKKHRKYNKYKV